MNVKRISPLAVAVSLALGGGNVWAGVNVDAPVTVNYATQVGNGVVLDSPAGSTTCNLNIVGKIGVPVPRNATRYMRFELTSGAKFGAKLENNSLVFGVSNGKPLIPTVVSGGADGSNFVIYSIKAEDTADIDAAVADDVFALTVTKITTGADKTPIQLSYSVHTNDVSASQGAAGTAVEKISANINYIGYSSGFSYGISPTNLTASVEKAFEVFNSSVNTNSDGTRGSLGKLSFAPATGVCSKGGGVITLSGASGLFQTSTTLEFKGDMNFLQDVDAAGEGLNTYGSTVTGVKKGSVGFYTNASCSTPVPTAPVATVAADGSKVVFSGAEVLNLNNMFLCVVRPEGSKVKITPADDYVLDLIPVTESGYSASAVSAPAGDIERDGVVLDAPYFTVAPGYISRFMLNHLNANGAEAAFTIELRTDAGNAVVPKTDGPYPYDEATKSFSGVLPAGTLLQINAADLVSSFTGKNRGSAVFTFVASNNDIQGIYQLVNTRTGELSNITMMRPGGGTGK